MSTTNELEPSPAPDCSSFDFAALVDAHIDGNYKPPPPAPRVSVLGVMIPDYVAAVIKEYGNKPVPENILRQYRRMGPATIAKLKAAGLPTITPKEQKRIDRENQMKKLRQKEARLLKLQSDVAGWLVKCREQMDRMNAAGAGAPAK